MVYTTYNKRHLWINIVNKSATFHRHPDNHFLLLEQTTTTVHNFKPSNEQYMPYEIKQLLNLIRLCDHDETLTGLFHMGRTFSLRHTKSLVLVLGFYWNDIFSALYNCIHYLLTGQSYQMTPSYITNRRRHMSNVMPDSNLAPFNQRLEYKWLMFWLLWFMLYCDGITVKLYP